MQILIATHHLYNYTGSKTWVFTVAKELSKNHEVVVTSPDGTGSMADKIKSILRVPVLSFDQLKGVFDIGILSQKPSAEVMRFCKKTVFVSHGPTEMDMPIEGCDKVVCHSEVAAEKWGIDIIIPQPIDTDWYNIPKKVLYASSMGRLAKMVESVCKKIGYEFRFARSTWNLREEFEWADIVIGASRVALEAMSCGKEVIIADDRPVFGEPLMDSEYNVSHNCSGARDRIQVTKSLLEEKLLKNRQPILFNHDVRNVCKQLLSI